MKGHATLMSSASDEWATPQDFFDAVDREFNFTLDAAASHDNAKCPDYFTAREDGLLRAWVNFPCDCLHALQTGVAGDVGVFRSELKEDKRIDLVVQALREGESKIEAGVSTSSRQGPSALGEAPPPPQPEGAGMEALIVAGRQPPKAGAASPIQVVSGGLDEVLGRVGAQVRVLRGVEEGRAGSCDSIVGPILPRNGSLEHRASLHHVQSRFDQQQQSTYCPSCGISGKPAVVWLNCPYSRIGEFIDKAITEHQNGVRSVLLVPARTDTKWFHRAVPHCSVRLIKGRLKFGGAASAPFPSALLLFDLDPNTTITAWDWRAA